MCARGQVCDLCRIWIGAFVAACKHAENPTGCGSIEPQLTVVHFSDRLDDRIDGVLPAQQAVGSAEHRAVGRLSVT